MIIKIVQMNNYYFTASKWYGPLGMTDPDFVKHKTPKHEKAYLDKWNNRIQELLSKGPSGDSLIPEFAGMVKEEGKDFAFEIHWNRNKGRSMPTHADLDKIAVPLEEKQTAVPVAEEGKQTFSEEKNQRRYPLPKLIKSLAYATEHISPGKKFVEFAETATEAERWMHNELANAFVAGWEAKTEYLKTKQ